MSAHPQLPEVRNLDRKQQDKLQEHNAKIAKLERRLASIGAGQIQGVHLADGSVTATTIAVGAVQATHISAGSISAGHIAANAIQANHISAGSISAGHIAANSIATNHLQAGSVTATQILAGSINADHITAGAIEAGHLSADSVTATAIQASTITGSKIAAGTITASNIMSSTITATQIAANTITAANIAAGTITATEIAATTITAAKIAANTITAAKIASGTITSTEIAASSITADRLASTLTLSSVIETAASPNARMSLSTVGLYGYAPGNVEKLGFDIATGSLRITGQLTAGAGSTLPVSYFTGTLAGGNRLTDSAFTWKNPTTGASMLASAWGTFFATNTIVATPAPMPVPDVNRLRLVATGAPITVYQDVLNVQPGVILTASGYFRAAATPRNVQAAVEFRDAANTVLATASSSGTVNDTTTTDTRAVVTTSAAPANTTYARIYYIVNATVASEVHYLTAPQVEQSEKDTSYAPKPAEIPDGAIVTSKLTAGTINGDRITANTLSVDRLATGTLASTVITLGTGGYFQTAASNTPSGRTVIDNNGWISYDSSGAVTTQITNALATFQGGTFRTADLSSDTYAEMSQTNGLLMVAPDRALTAPPVTSTLTIKRASTGVAISEYFSNYLTSANTTQTKIQAYGLSAASAFSRIDFNARPYAGSTDPGTTLSLLSNDGGTFVYGDYSAYFTTFYKGGRIFNSNTTDTYFTVAGTGASNAGSVGIRLERGGTNWYLYRPAATTQLLIEGNNSTHRMYDGGETSIENALAGSYVFQAFNTHSTYAGSVIRAFTTRGDSSGYNAFAFYNAAGGGGTNRFAVDGRGWIFSTNTAVQAISDAALKTDIVDLEAPMSVLNVLRPRTFKWRDTNIETPGVGFVAQEVELVYPDATSELEGVKTVGAATFIPHLVGAAQEHDREIGRLKSEVAALRTALGL